MEKTKKTTTKSKSDAVKMAKTEVKAVESATTRTRQKYIYARGGRKTSLAQCYLYKTGKGHFTVNGKDYKEYFPTENLQTEFLSPLVLTALDKNVDASIKVHGGGKHSQTGASRHALARALEILDPKLRPILKAESFLKRDPRVKERKKPGLKRARRSPQWSKR